jgi:2'-5' RNA ligase
VDTTRNDYDGHQAAATTTTTTTTSTTNTAQKKNSKKQPEPRRSDRPGEKSKKKPNKQERLRNRPGFNSYLKVVLDETALQFLHDTTADIVRSFHEKFPLVEKVDPEAISTTTAAAASTPTTEKTDDLNTGKNEDDKVNMETNESSSNIKNDDSSSETKEENNSSSSSYILKIKPRSFDSLHMTLFFGGEVLCKLPAEALTEWHSQITTRLAQSGFQLEKNYERTTTVSAEEEVPSVTAAATEESTSCTDATKKLIIPPNTKNPEYSFRITKICTFPLRRNNLIVAILEATPEFYQLHDDIRAVAATSSCKDLKQIVKCSKNIWTPHITLANILKPRKSDGVGGKKRIDFQSQMKMLEDILAQYSQMEEITLSSCVTVSGIAMGGPMPQQAELDFDFQYHNPR